MTRPFVRSTSAMLAAAFVGLVVLGAEVAAESKATLSKEARRAFIARAQVWQPTDVARNDVRTGPAAPDGWLPDEMVACEYVEAKLSGSSRKFDCALESGEVVRVRYGAENGEVEGAVLTSRLLWALGFGANREYPVRVTCRGCSSDPWKDRRKSTGTYVFDLAVIERRPLGEAVNTKDPGWAWPELSLIDESAGGASQAQRDALRLLAVFVQHTDNKPQQQGLLCLAKASAEADCDKPMLFLSDVGLTFGRANYWNRASTASVNFEKWQDTPIWRDPAACVGHLSQAATGTLSDPKISEAGRQFLADLLAALTDQQIQDLFEIARVERRLTSRDESSPSATAEEWARVFKQKRDGIVNHHCPA